VEFPRKQLLVVGDRVLVTPEEGEETRTRVGLYLPPTAVETQQVQSGLIVATGPGEPMADPRDLEDEPWKAKAVSRRSTMQAKVGDHALFFRKAAVEITFEDRKYLVVPQAAILVLIREELPL